MANYAVSIIPENGMVVVTSSGGDDEFCRSFPPGALEVYYRSNLMSLVEVSTGQVVCSFSVSQCSAPNGSTLAQLRAAINRIIAPSGGGSSSNPLTPMEVVFVSKDSGSSDGTGAIDAPLDTIAAGIALAQTNTTSTTPWSVHVLPGTYWEQIKPGAGSAINIELYGGVTVNSGHLDGTVDDVGLSVSIFMHPGSKLKNSVAAPVVQCRNSDSKISGFGMIEMSADNTSGVIVNTLDAMLSLEGLTLLNYNQSTGSLVVSGLGTCRLNRCALVHVPSSMGTGPAVLANGSGLKMGYSQIFAPNATNSIGTISSGTVQVVNCVSNKAKAAGVTETVGTLLVDAGFAI